MINRKIEQYEIKNLVHESCPVCKELSNVYNLQTSRYQFEIPKEIGRGHIRQIISCKDIQIVDFDMTFSREVEFQGISNTSHIDMFFCIGDEIGWEFRGKSDYFELLNGESLFAKAESKENIKRCIYLPERNFHFMEIKIHPKKFEQIVENIKKEWDMFSHKKHDDIFYRYKITPSINVILQQIIKCPYEKGLKNIYMEGKILELFAIYFNEMIYQKKTHNSVRLSNEDITSIYRAKEILDNNIVNPPTLTVLSRMICLNEFKLKNGFKEIFNQTVYAYIMDKRLETARLLLEEKNLQVSDVASKIGYANASHFALAFRKKFGINPGEYLRNIVRH